MKGLYIAFEGIDGSGKSTIIEKIKEYYIASNISNVIYVREPSANIISYEDPLANFLSFSADRSLLFKNMVIPALMRGDMVISDRSIYSSVAYQGFGDYLSINFINYVNNVVTESIVPDLTIYLHISLKDALERVSRRNIKESEEYSEEFLERVIAGYNEMFLNKSNNLTLEAMNNLEDNTRLAILFIDEIR